MASIKGISIKNYSEWETPRGLAYRGILLIDSTEIGDFYNEGNGGCIHITIDKEYRDSFDQRMDQYYVENPAVSHDADDFLIELISLHDYEKAYKEYQYPILVVGYSYTRMTPVIEIDDLDVTFYSLSNEQSITKLLAEKKHRHVEIFRSLEDFDMYPYRNKRPRPASFDNEDLLVRDMEDEKEYVIGNLDEYGVAYATVSKKNDQILVTFTASDSIDDKTIHYPLSAHTLIKELDEDSYLVDRSLESYSVHDLYSLGLALELAYMDLAYNFPEPFHAQIKMYQNNELI